jgi:hypothetical protein
MKSKRFLIFVVTILAFTFIVPASAEHIPRDHRPIIACDDHPWGGDSDDVDPIIGGKVVIPELIGTPVFFINAIYIIVIPNDQQIDNEMLPNNFGGGNGHNSGNTKG